MIVFCWQTLFSLWSFKLNLHQWTNLFPFECFDLMIWFHVQKFDEALKDKLVVFSLAKTSVDFSVTWKQNLTHGELIPANLELNCS